MAAYKNDGSIPYAGVVPSIGGVSYVAKSFSVKRPSTKLEQRDDLNEPSGKVTSPDFVTGSATLQLSTTSTAYPAIGAEFTLTLDAVIGSETFYITDRDDVRNVGEIRMVPVEFSKKYN